MAALPPMADLVFYILGRKTTLWHPVRTGTRVVELTRQLRDKYPSLNVPDETAITLWKLKEGTRFPEEIGTLGPNLSERLDKVNLNHRILDESDFPLFSKEEVNLVIETRPDANAGDKRRRISESEPLSDGSLDLGQGMSNSEKAALLGRVKISLEKTKPILKSDLERNDIQSEQFAGSESELTDARKSKLPEAVRIFYDTLVARVKVKKFSTELSKTGQLSTVLEELLPPAPDRLEFYLISILKQCLGQEFSLHFEEVEDYTSDPGHLRRLESYTSAIFRHEGKDVNFAKKYTAVAKEACLTGILVDPALDRILPGYSRDQRTSSIVVEFRGDLCKWTPREDFCVAYGEGTTRYALLNGETDSDGESDTQAMRRMAVISKYSHQVIREIAEQDTVILSAWVSEGLCTMHLFYRVVQPDAGDKPYVMQQILSFGNVFANPSRSVGFLRRLHNFAAQVQAVKIEEKQQKRKKFALFQAGGDLPSVAASTTNNSRSTKPKTGGNSASEAPVPSSSALEGLAIKYKIVSRGDLDNCSIRRIRQIPPKVGPYMDLIAKWTTNTSEVELITSLQAETHPRYRNGVILVTDIVRPGTLGAFLIMPRYSPLNSLSRVTPTDYRNLRLQVIEDVAFLHAQNVAHRDLKPANMVVDLKRGLSRARAYLIDFGNARRCTPEYRCHGFQGTKGWTAPEIKDGAHWEPMSADVWAMAKTLLYLARIAGIPDQLMSDVIACREPSSRPTAAALFDILNVAQPGRTKRVHRVSVEPPHAKFRALPRETTTQSSTVLNTRQAVVT